MSEGNKFNCKPTGFPINEPVHHEMYKKKLFQVKAARTLLPIE